MLEGFGVMVVVLGVEDVVVEEVCCDVFGVYVVVVVNFNFLG